MADKRISPWLGLSVPRVEDRRLVRGAGRFLDDIRVEHALTATFVRSPVAHARLKGIDLAAARALPGVHAVLAYDDLRSLLKFDRIPLALPARAVRFDADPFALARDEVCYVGEPLAVVIADTRAIAEDAAALVELDFETLPAVLDPAEGLEKNSPKARLDCPDNLVARHAIKYGDAAAGFKAAAHRVADRFRLNKGGGHSIEPRGVLARVDETVC